MLAAATSPWLAIGPALIAGGIGLVSAFLAFYSARRALRHTAEQAQASRAHERDLLVLRQRISAAETVWLRIFELEQSGAVSDEARDDLVRAVLWLPDDARRQLLELLVALGDGQPAPPEDLLRRVRESLIDLVGVPATSHLREEGVHV